jgi:methylthioribose-1-phosphate isomerase
MINSIEWKKDHIRIIDQTKLPFETVYADLFTVEDVYESIQQLKIRGAPAIGIIAAYGLYQAFKNIQSIDREEFFNLLKEKSDYLASSRLTAINLQWALQKINDDLKASSYLEINSLKDRLLGLALEIHEDDRKRCESIADYGQKILHNDTRILTHCNTGALATGGIGTALGVIHKAHQLGKNIEVFATESRPVLQGARLTVWELDNLKIPVTLICDSACAFLMKQEKVDVILVGADRIASNGATANKIGTYNLAILADYHKIPFYVVAPLSTFDFNIKSENEIPIEYRDADEIRKVFNKFPITLPKMNCWNPAFDITPPDLISGVITELGVISPPYEINISKVLKNTVTI